MIKIDYISTVDISQPFGPSTNEYETVKYLLDNCDSIVYLPILQDTIRVDRRNIKNFNWLGKGILIPLQALKVVFIDSLRRRKSPLLIRLDQAGILWLVPFFCRLIGRPFHLIHLQDPIENILKNKGKSEVRSKIMIRTFYQIVQMSRTIETTQKEFFNHYRRIFPKKTMTIVPHGVNIEMFYPKSRKVKTVVVGYVGGFPFERGGRQVLKIISHFRKSNIDCRGLIVGDSKRLDGKSEANELRNMVSEQGLEKYIDVIGYIPYEHVKNYFQMINIGLALVPETELHERGNSSQKIYQYMACGAHVILPAGTHPHLSKKEFVHECNWDQSNMLVLVDNIMANKKHLLSDKVRQAAFKLVKEKYSIKAKFDKRFNLWLDFQK